MPRLKVNRPMGAVNTLNSVNFGFLKQNNSCASGMKLLKLGTGEDLDRIISNAWAKSMQSSQRLPATKPQIYLSTLQSLRGIAAIVVLLRHSTLSFPSSGSFTDFVESVVFNSHAAVVVFFVLSGFVLSLSLDNRQMSTASVGGFYIKRLFRILPLLVFVTILSLLYTLSPVSGLAVAGSTHFFMGLLMHRPPHAMTVLLSLVGLNSHYVPQNWTIMVELLVAPAFPFLFFLSRMSRNLLALMLAVAVIASLAAPLGGRWLPVAYTADFLLGIGGFLIWSRNMPVDHRFLPVAAVAAFIVLITARPVLTACDAPLIDPNNFHDATSGLIEALAASVLILALVGHAKVARALSGRILVFLGDISFSLYLVHFLIIVLFARFLDRFVPAFSDLNNLARNCIFALLVLLISVPVSALLYRLLELPCNRFGRRLAAFDAPTPALPPRPARKPVVETLPVARQ